MVCGLVLAVTTRGSGGTAHTCSGRHSQYSCELLAWAPELYCTACKTLLSIQASSGYLLGK